MTRPPVHAAFDGPIVLIGFGSIGKGALPLILRHIRSPREKMVVIAPDDSDRRLAESEGVRFEKLALTPREPARRAERAARRGRVRRQRVGRGVVARRRRGLSRAGRALPRHLHRALARRLHRRVEVALGALELRAARGGPRAAQRGGADGDPRARRQSGHGQPLREAGAADAGRPRRPRSLAADAGGLGPAGARPGRQGHPHRRARYAASEHPEAARTSS